MFCAPFIYWRSTVPRTCRLIIFYMRILIMLFVSGLFFSSTTVLYKHKTNLSFFFFILFKRANLSLLSLEYMANLSSESFLCHFACPSVPLALSFFAEALLSNCNFYSFFINVERMFLTRKSLKFKKKFSKLKK
jgi:hypothetical protein